MTSRSNRSRPRGLDAHAAELVAGLVNAAAECVVLALLVGRERDAVMVESELGKPAGQARVLERKAVDDAAKGLADGLLVEGQGLTLVVQLLAIGSSRKAKAVGRRRVEHLAELRRTRSVALVDDQHERMGRLRKSGQFGTGGVEDGDDDARRLEGRLPARSEQADLDLGQRCASHEVVAPLAGQRLGGYDDSGTDTRVAYAMPRARQARAMRVLPPPVTISKVPRYGVSSTPWTQARTASCCQG